MYSIDLGGPYDLGVTATYSCDDGFSLENGDSVQICNHDGVSVFGEWTGVAPECVGKSIVNQLCV